MATKKIEPGDIVELVGVARYEVVRQLPSGDWELKWFAQSLGGYPGRQPRTIMDEKEILMWREE